MTKRTKNNLKLIAVMIITVVLAVLAVQTIWVGVNLVWYSNDVIESQWHADSYPQIRMAADEVYNEITAGRDKFYNSSNPFIHWLANMNNNLIRLPLGLLIIVSPALFILLVRAYNMNNRRKRVRV